MRKLRGYIRRITDGNAPPAGSVEVHARPRVDDLDINAATHALGDLVVDHQASSGSATVAAADGSFGWQMELSPGLIETTAHPTDPQEELHIRFPDESSQVGMAFHSDIQRLGWAAGGDGMIWNAIPGGDDPSAAAWSTNPNDTWNLGNGSIASFGVGQVTVRPFIAFLGGVLFSVERGNLVCPTQGGPAAANASGQERWDLLSLVLNTDANSDAYGQQSIRITTGVPGAGIPTPTAPTATERRLPFQAMRMPAGSGTYNAAYDLRQWRGEPRRVVVPPVVKKWNQPDHKKWRTIRQEVTYGQQEVHSIINTTLSADELIVPAAASYQGLAVWNAHVSSHDGKEDDENAMGVLVTSEAYDSAGVLVPGTNYVVSPEDVGMPVILVQRNKGMNAQNLTFPIAVIPSYDIFSQVNEESRAWSRLRFKVFFNFNEPPVSTGSKFRIHRQSLTVSLWPVT